MVVASTHEIVALDANFVVAALIQGTAASKQIETWVRRGWQMQISAVAWSEYMCGPVEPHIASIARRLVGIIDVFTAEEAELTAKLFNATGRRSRSHADCMIAAHAIRRDAVLATADAPDFRVFRKFGLRLQ